MAVDGRQTRYWDTQQKGLYVIAYPAQLGPSGSFRYCGAKVFWCSVTIRKRLPSGLLRKRRRQRRIGPLGEVTVEQARAETALQIAAAFEGRDLAREESEAREAEERRQKSTLGRLLMADYAQHMAQFKTGDKIVRQLRAQFAEWLDLPLEEITQAHIERWKWSKQKRLKPASINRPLQYLSACFNYAIDHDLTATSPFQAMKTASGRAKWKMQEHDSARVRFLSEAELARLQKALRARDYRKRGNLPGSASIPSSLPNWCQVGFTDYLEPLVRVALQCGLRRGELFALTWEDLDFQHSVITVQAHYAKTSRTRRVQMLGDSVSVLRRWHKDRLYPSSGLVFPSPRTGRRLITCDNGWRALLRVAGISDFRFHDMRHHAASMLVQAGASLYYVQKIMGHSSIQMTERYSHLAPDSRFVHLQTLKAVP